MKKPTKTPKTNKQPPPKTKQKIKTKKRTKKSKTNPDIFLLSNFQKKLRVKPVEVKTTVSGDPSKSG